MYSESTEFDHVHSSTLADNLIHSYSTTLINNIYLYDHLLTIFQSFQIQSNSCTITQIKLHLHSSIQIYLNSLKFVRIYPN